MRIIDWFWIIFKKNFTWLLILLVIFTFWTMHLNDSIYYYIISKHFPLISENIIHKVNNNRFFFNLSTKLIKTFSKTVIEPIINSFSWLTIISLIRDGCGCKDGIINTERNDIRHVCGKPNTIRKITNYIVHRWIQFILLFRANSPSFFA